MACVTVDELRKEIRETNFRRLTDEQVEALSNRYEIAKLSKEITRTGSVSELDAFYEMILEERVPEPLAGDYLRRFLRRSDS